MNSTAKITYTANAENFSKIPGSPIAYWVSNSIFSCFDDVVNNQFEAMKGIQTGNGEKYLRLWFEVSKSKTGFNVESYNQMLMSKLKWFPLTSGGEIRKWYGNFEYIVNLYNDGEDIRKTGLKNYRLKESKYYFLEGITWTEVTTKTFSCRYLPSNILFGNGGPTCFNAQNVFYLIGLFNSIVIGTIMKIIAPTINCGPDQVRSIPVKLRREDYVNNHVRENIALSKTDWDSFETSWDFKKHPLI